MGLLGNAFSAACDFVGSCISSAVETFSNGFSLIVDGFTGITRGIADGIKTICDTIGTEGILLIGSIALSLIIPGFGIPEILALIQIVGKIAQMLQVVGEDTPEELGMKTEIADKKPDDFDSIEAYLKYLNEEVKLEPDAVEKLTLEEKAKYGLIGASLEIKAIQEKYHIELSPDFLRDVTLMKLSGEEVGAYVEDFKEKGITKMQDMTDYLRGNGIETEKSKVSSAILDTMKELYPELSDDELEDKLTEMENELRSNIVE